MKTTDTITSDVRVISGCGLLKRDTLVTDLEISLKEALSECDSDLTVLAETHGKLDRYMSMHARDRADRLQRHSLSRNEAVLLEQIDANVNGEIYFCTDDDSDNKSTTPLVTEHLVSSSKSKSIHRYRSASLFLYRQRQMHVIMQRKERTTKTEIMHGLTLTTTTPELPMTQGH